MYFAFIHRRALTKRESGHTTISKCGKKGDRSSTTGGGVSAANIHSSKRNPDQRTSDLQKGVPRAVHEQSRTGLNRTTQTRHGARTGEKAIGELESRSETAKSDDTESDANGGEK